LQGHVVTTDLPTLGTNPNSKQHGSATQEAKILGDLQYPRRTVCGDRADGPRGGGKRSAGQGGQSKNGHRTSSMHPTKFGRSVSSLRKVRSSRTVWPHLADGPTNCFQTKPTGQTDRNEATQELAKNTTNTWLKSSSRTVRLTQTDGPPGMGAVARA
jgi:hypothetical protein